MPRKTRQAALIAGTLLLAVLVLLLMAWPREHGERASPTHGASVPGGSGVPLPGASGASVPGQDVTRHPAPEEVAAPAPPEPPDDDHRLREEVLRWALDAGGSVCLETPDRYFADLWNVKWHRTRENVPEGALTGVSGPKSGADAWLAAMPRGATLHTMNLGNSDVTAAGLDRLGGREDIRVLVLLLASQLSSEDLRVVANLPSLEILVVTGADLDDTALAVVAGARNLRRLELSGHRITDAGVQHLLGLPKLEELDLAATKVSPASIRPLARMPTLRRLSLSGVLPLDRAALDAAR